MPDTGKKTNGVNCTVKSCIYHVPGDCCEAGEIEVGNPAAVKCGETLCNTFEIKKK